MLDTFDPFEARTLWMILLAASAVMVIAAFLVAMTRRSRRSRTAMLRERFGPEYERAVEEEGERRGEKVLQARVLRIDRVKFRDLSDAERVRLSRTWSNVQAQFVDDPRGAVARANQLIKDVMRARGYCADEAFEQRVADLSVDHPDVVQHYRAAHALAVGGAHGEMNTEDLRQSMVHYRVLFADLLQPSMPMARVLRPAHA